MLVIFGIFLQQTKAITSEHLIVKEAAVIGTINRRITTTTATKTTTITILVIITTETTTIKIEIETVISTSKDDLLDRTEISMNLETDILEDKVCKAQLKYKNGKKTYFQRTVVNK